MVGSKNKTTDAYKGEVRGKSEIVNLSCVYSDGAAKKPLYASHQCGQRSNPGASIICGFSLLRFSSSLQQVFMCYPSIKRTDYF